MPRDPEKAKARWKRYREKKKAEKYGPAAAGVNMTGRHGNHARGPRNANWNDGLAKHEDGYLKVQVGKSPPLADPNGYTYLHLLVWIGAGRPAPGPEELIHHRDGCKTNNRIENLELMTRTDHAKYHAALRGRDASGRFPAAPAQQVTT